MIWPLPLSSEREKSRRRKKFGRGRLLNPRFRSSNRFAGSLEWAVGSPLRRLTILLLASFIADGIFTIGRVW